MLCCVGVFDPFYDIMDVLVFFWALGMASAPGTVPYYPAEATSGSLVYRIPWATLRAVRLCSRRAAYMALESLSSRQLEH